MVSIGFTGFSWNFRPTLSTHLAKHTIKRLTCAAWHAFGVCAAVLRGGRVSLAVGFAATAVSLVIGVIWGAVAGYFGGRVDQILMRIVDVLYALPFLIFVVLLMVMFERKFFLICLKICKQKSGWITHANQSAYRKYLPYGSISAFVPVYTAVLFFYFWDWVRKSAKNHWKIWITKDFLPIALRFGQIFDPTPGLDKNFTYRPGIGSEF